MSIDYCQGWEGKEDLSNSARIHQEGNKIDEPSHIRKLNK